MTPFKPCAVIPTYNNPNTVEDVVRVVSEYLPDIFVVDDGSGPEGRAAVESAQADGLCRVIRRGTNGGKGAAVKDGLEAAAAQGFTHALQVDADGQHNLSDIPRFLEIAERAPDSLILGEPIFDESAPKSRLEARKLTLFWTRVETGGQFIADPMCGFRVYPIQETLEAGARGNRMDFDIEVAVRMVWRGVPVVNVPTKVRYISEEEGGVSHFRLVRDNIWISWAHTRLSIQSLWRRARFRHR